MVIVPVACAAFVALMVGASFAAVPLYDLFCRVTGFGGTPAVASVDVVPGLQPRDREVTIRFDANVANGLPWTFTPARPMTVRVGEVAEASYVIENRSSRPTVGTTVFNVTPPQTGGYFTKIQCFCFNVMPLGPGERQEVKVVFYVDPAFDDDPEAHGTHVLTLSYTVFPAPGEPATPAEG
jgi:cytochrome c oxidase assembly protein subunit 11